MQTAEGQITGEIYYILIERADNETRFIPNEITLPNEITVVLINNDSTSDHNMAISNEKGELLFNSLVPHNNFVKYKFESEGTYFFSHSGNTEPDGTLTIVSNTDNTAKISEPLPGIENIISSLGFN